MHKPVVATAAPVRDLVLWDVLHDEGADPRALTAALLQVAALAPSRLRALLTGPLPRLATHGDPAVRTAAAHALQHAHGHTGAVALAQLLNDADAQVRRTATRAADAHSPRLASIALFHRRDDVRADLLEHGVGLPWGELAFLLPDPTAAALVRARLDRDPREPHIAATLVRADAHELMDRAEARARMEQLAWDDPGAIIGALPYAFSISDKDLETAAGIHAALARPWMRDSLVDVLEICATRARAVKDSALDDTSPVIDGLFRALSRGKLPVPLQRRLALSVALKALTVGSCPPRLLALACVAAPAVLELALPAEDKRRALAACVDLVIPEGGARGKLTALPRELLVVDGALHLRATAGAMRLLASDPYVALGKLEPDRAHLLRAVDKSPRDAAALVQIPPQSPADKLAFDALVPALLALRLPARALGALVLALPHQGQAALRGVEAASPGRAEECLMAALEALTHTHGDDPVRDVRLERAVSALAGTLRREAIPRLLADVVTHANGTSAQCAPFSNALIRAGGPALAEAVVLACRPRGQGQLVHALEELSLSPRLERAYALALAKDDHPAARAWAQLRLEERSEALALEDDSAALLRTAPDAAVLDVARDALERNLSGVAEILLDRVSLPREPLVAAAALCLGDPLHQGAALFQRAVREEAAFLLDVDATLTRPDVRRDLPLLATAWLHTHPLHSARFDLMARHLGPAGLLELACDLPAPLVMMKLAAATVAVCRSWATQRPVLLERGATPQLAHVCFSILAGTRTPRPAEAGTSRLQSSPSLMLAVVDLLLVLARAGARTSGTLNEVLEPLRKLKPALPPEVRDALAPLLPALPAPHEAPSAAAPFEPDSVPAPADEARTVTALDALLRAETPASGPDEAARAGLRAFLRAGDDRPRELRLFAAEALARVGVFESALWLRMILDDTPLDEVKSLVRDHGDDIPLAVWHQALASAKTAGSALDDTLLVLLRSCRLADPVAAAIARHLLQSPDLDDDDVRELFAWVRRARPSEDERVERLKDALRWGVKQGRKLLGRGIGIELIHDAWGYTRLGTPRVYVNPLPILRGERDGEDVVRGLLVHEIGHQLYHADPASRAVWDGAGKRKLQSLLNLVADEHLERNLRSVSAEYGDALKTLCSHAFQHAAHDVDLDELLQVLGARAFAVLSRVQLLPGRRADTVRVDVGRLLREFAAAGGSFARFVRALRQGLGVREADDKVKAGLALFSKRSFRTSTMAELMAITDELVRIFGREAELLSAVGLHEVMDSGESDLLAEGLSPEELKDLESTKRASSGARGRPVFNKGHDEHFDTIDHVVRLTHEPEEHRAVALEGRRGSATLRRTFEELGLRAVTERRRLTGRALDRSGLAAAVARRDPRILVRRTLTPAPDLFVGVLVDCSGSMQREGCIDRARVFATLIAEAARGLQGIDVRVLGFTDRVLFDAGDSERCAAHALQADGGNNDAAALWHGSLLAKLSKRRARLLVMISDGLPTECTLGALRALVQRLERQGTACAQVAVRPLAEHAFRHYVEILDDDAGAAARRFAAVVTRLVKSTVR